MKKLFSVIIGDSQLPLKQRLFNIFLLAGIFLLLLSSVINIVSALNLISIFAPIIFSLILVILFILSRIKKWYSIPVGIAIFLLVFVFLPVMWVFNGGTMGASQYFSIFFGIIISALYRGKARNILVLFLIIILLSLILIEYFSPDIIHGYSDRNSRFFDITFGIILSITATFFLFNTYVINYEKEHKKVLEYTKKLQLMAITDGLTGLYNHSYILKLLEEEIAKSKQHKEPLSVIMFDIDHFKKLNDDYGHQFGDRVLKKVSLTIKNNFRKSELIGRYGGEEFMVILPKANIMISYERANTIRQIIENIQFENEVKLTISGGVAELKDQDYDALIKKADDLLYKAKKLGRNIIIK